MKWLKGPPPNKLKSSDLVGIDLEMFDCPPKRIHRGGELACAAFAVDEETVYVVDTIKDFYTALERTYGAQWVFHNASFDEAQIRRMWPHDPRPIWDTFLIEKVLWNGWYSDYSLDDLTRRNLGILLDKGVRKEFYKKQAVTDEMMSYNAKDAWATRKLVAKQSLWLEKDPMSWEVYSTIDLPAFWAILDMKGIHLNRERWLAIAERYEKRGEEITRQLGFNPNSHIQVKDQIKKQFGVSLPNSQEDTLIEFATHAKAGPTIQLILEAKKCTKRAGTYGRDVILTRIEEDGRWYPSYNVLGTSTGRMSASGIQQIPKEAEYRECFDAEGAMIIADYHQQEPMITAEISKDPRLLAAIRAGEDLHLFVTREIFHDPTIQKDDERRRKGKAINLGMVYGLSEYGLSEQTGMSLEDARHLLSVYFKRFVGVKFYIDSYRAKALREGFVRTLSGRRFFTNPHNYKSKNNAINSPVQGTGADITKRALAYLHHHYGKDIPLVGVIHDEILLETPVRQAKKTEKVLRDCMVRAFKDFCPNVQAPKYADIHIGTTWNDK